MALPCDTPAVISDILPLLRETNKHIAKYDSLYLFSMEYFVKKL